MVIIFVIFSALVPAYGQPPDPPQFHYIVGSATYEGNGSFANGGLVTVTNMNTSETLTDIVGVSGKSNQSGWYLVNLLDLSQGYRHGDIIQILITGTNNFSDWQGDNTITIDNTTFSQIVHVTLNSCSYIPHPSFYWTPLSPSTNDTIHFTDFSSDDGSIISWMWEFGDGTTSYLKNPVHIYTDNGDYQVNLTVMDNQENIATLSKSIHITNLPPHANFSYTISNIMTVAFMDMSWDMDGTAVEWYWEFGDGHTSVQQNPGHRYENPGIYSVYLCIRDDDGDQAHITHDIVLSQESHITVTITYPPASEQLNGTKTLRGNTDSIVPIQRVDIKIDNGPWQEATGTTNWTYLWNTKEVENGNHILYARAYDGNIFSPIASVMTEVYNNHPATLSITKPQENQTIKGKTTIQGWATDKDGNATIQNVDLRVDAGNWATALGTTVWLYELNTSALTNGYHTLEARAYDGIEYSESYFLVIKVDNRDTVYGFDKAFVYGGIASILAFMVALLVIVAVLIRDKTKDKSHHKTKSSQKKKI